MRAARKEFAAAPRDGNVSETNKPNQAQLNPMKNSMSRAILRVGDVKVFATGRKDWIFSTQVKVRGTGWTYGSPITEERAFSLAQTPRQRAALEREIDRIGGTLQ